MSGLRTTSTIPTLVPALVPALVLALAACGGGSTTSGPAAPSAPAGATGQPAPSGGGGRQPGVSGKTAEISGNTLQVQGTDGQTAVQFSASTRVTEQKPATVAAVVTGSCVVAVGQPDGGSGLTADLVTVSPAAGGSCTGADLGGRGGGGFRPQRSGQASGSPGSGNAGGDRTGTPVSTAFGTVTAVTSGSITLSGRLRSFTRGGQGSPSATGASPTPERVTVTVGASTRYVSTASVTSKALAVGQCVTALGTANEIGTVSARSIVIRPAGPQGCTTGVGGGGFGGRRAGAGSASGASGA